MKNLLFVLAVAIVIMFSACSKSAQDNQTQADTTVTHTNLLIGKWLYTTDSIKYYTNGNLDSLKVLNYYQTDNIVFNVNSTGIETRGGIAEDFKYTVLNQDIQFLFNSSNVSSVKTKTDGIRTDASTGTTIVGLVKQISSTNMTLVFETVNGEHTTDEIAYFTH